MLDLEKLDPSERSIGAYFRVPLDLEQRSREFDRALGLYVTLQQENATAALARDFEQARRFFDWSFVAARDCAMGVYHFGRILDGCGNFLRDMPVFRSQIDLAAMKSVRKQFDENFRWYISLRHAIAHDAERTSTPEATEKHAAKEGKIEGFGHSEVATNGMLLLKESLRKDEFSSMWAGVVYTIQLKSETSQKLHEIATSYRKIFAPFEAPPEVPKIAVSKRKPKGVTIIDIT